MGDSQPVGIHLRRICHLRQFSLSREIFRMWTDWINCRLNLGLNFHILNFFGGCSKSKIDCFQGICLRVHIESRDLFSLNLRFTDQRQFQSSEGTDSGRDSFWWTLKDLTSESVELWSIDPHIRLLNCISIEGFLSQHEFRDISSARLQIQILSKKVIRERLKGPGILKIFKKNHIWPNVHSNSDKLPA